MLLATLMLVFGLQEPPPPQPPEARPEARPDAGQQQPEPAPQPPPPAYDDKEAKAAVAEFGKAIKAGSMAARMQALDQLTKGSHKLLVKPLAQVIDDDKSLVVKKRAAALLALQPATEVTPIVLRLLQDEDLKKQPQVRGELVRTLARTGYQKKHWPLLEAMFEKDYAAECVPLQEAILELVALHKEEQAVPLLLRNMDEPGPDNVDDASNPPAEYWEARWKAWKSWRSRVKDAMFTLTGQRFSSAAEAQAWLRKNRK